MKYQTTTQWRYSKIMNDLVTHLLSIRRLNRRKILTAGALLSTQAVLVFLWSFISAPLSASPAGPLALALLFLTRSAYWPTIFIGSVVGMTFAAVPPFLLFACALSYTLQGITGSRFLKIFEFNLLLARLRDSVVLISVLIGTTLIFPSVSFGIDFLFSGAPLLTDSSFVTGITWGKAWISTLFAFLIFTPLILRWSVVPHARNVQEFTETVFALGLTAVISSFLFWTETQSIGGISLAYFLIIPLFWCALRLGPRMTVTALALASSIGLSFFIYQSYTFGLSTVNLQQLFQTELFFTMLSMIFLLIVSIEEERKEKTLELEAYVSGLRTEIRELSDDDRLKNEFIATLAHELRNPLAPVVSTLELLMLRDELSREALQLVKRVQHQTETVKRLLDDLLDVTRITQKKFKLRKEHSSLRELISHCESNAEHIMHTYNHRFTVTLPKNDVTVFVDPTRFEQIVTNLLYNAAKYTEPGGRIELRCDIEKNNLVIRLRDNGIGIDPDKIEQIFLPFKQMPTRHHTGTGLGIGLAITKQLVEMHDGTIVAKSEGHDKGSEFVVTMPIVDKNEKNAERSNNANEIVRRRTILVVDDNEDAAKALMRLLEFKGHQVYIAHSGKEALENTRLFKPEIILLDIGLPDMDGYEVARQMRQGGVSARIIAVTGYGQDEDRSASSQAGFDHHLVKPVSLSEVEKVL